jgi:hypothetical protein
MSQTAQILLDIFLELQTLLSHFKSQNLLFATVKYFKKQIK